MRRRSPPRAAQRRIPTGSASRPTATEPTAERMPVCRLRWARLTEARGAAGASGVWRSLVARFVRDEEVAGSNPVTPTAVTPGQSGFADAP
jgi:hypothetical protein